MTKLLINVALTGMVPTTVDNPHVPVTARAIAADVRRCYDAGASVFHIHARHADETPAHESQYYQEIIAAIRDGRRPEGMSSDETLIYNFSTELLHNRRVSDSSFAAMAARFGRPGVVDLVSILGYYTFNAMVLNTARYPAKDGSTIPHFPE